MASKMDYVGEDSGEKEYGSGKQKASFSQLRFTNFELTERPGDVAHMEGTSPERKDSDLLQSLGLEQQTKRYISGLEILSVGFTICLSWLGVISILQLVLSQGGSVTLMYGILIIFTMYACIVGTLAELASVYPTAGGQ